MQTQKLGVISMGIKTPIIREGDNIVKIVTDSVLDATFNYDERTKKYWYDISDKDVIGVTESVVARSIGNYVSLDEIAAELENRFGPGKTYLLDSPIYSRNRFSMILKGIARTASIVAMYMPPFDEVGNPSGVNQFTGVDILEYYKEIVQLEGTQFAAFNYAFSEDKEEHPGNPIVIYCGLHDYREWKLAHPGENYITLADICSDKCEFGLLGSNKATEEKIKLFPDKVNGQRIVEEIKKNIYEKTGKHVEVMIYGDGCFKDPVGGIWEFADPEASPAFTSGLIGRPNEIKIKAFADDKFGMLSGRELEDAIKKEICNKDNNLIGNMSSQGTTPRRYTDLLASLMDLTSGSGDRGTPVILVKNYFTNYAG